MNLFWETRHLTPAREDHLTCFVAAALEADSRFRTAYEDRLLGFLPGGQTRPVIVGVKTQVFFEGHRSLPDMLLELDDGRRVVCEHKLDALETVQVADDGGVSLQLERYLRLPDIAAVAYFRSSLKPPANAVLQHPRYLRPGAAPHFLWRDLYEPLLAGDQRISAWLRDGFERLGFTPPLPHIGELWPNEDKHVKENQRNFAKLWHSARSHLSGRWKIQTGSRCELYLYPKGPSLAGLVYVSPLAQGGTLLRLRLSKIRGAVSGLHHTLDKVITTFLPVQPEVAKAKMGDGTPCLDLLSSLRLVLGDESDAAKQEARLFAQVVPVIEALMRDA